jgi:hypothetical protein
MEVQYLVSASTSTRYLFAAPHCIYMYLHGQTKEITSTIEVAEDITAEKDRRIKG